MRTAARWWTRSWTRAGQKGTGRWTVVSALDAGIPLTLIAEAVLARAPLGAERRARGSGASCSTGPLKAFRAMRKRFVADIQQSSVRLQDHFLRPGLYADARSGRRNTAGI